MAFIGYINPFKPTQWLNTWITATKKPPNSKKDEFKDLNTELHNLVKTNRELWKKEESVDFHVFGDPKKDKNTISHQNPQSWESSGKMHSNAVWEI